MGADHLEVRRIGNNVVARTSLGRPLRLLSPAISTLCLRTATSRAVIEGDRCSGLGAADMKGGVAVMLELAKSVVSTGGRRDYVLYACEEVEQRFSGLIADRGGQPELLAADAAVLAEPTSAVVEAGCQGVLRVVVSSRW